MTSFFICVLSACAKSKRRSFSLHDSKVRARGRACVCVWLRMGLSSEMAPPRLQRLSGEF